MGYLASSPEFRAYEENVFVATGGEKILPFRPADGFILVKNRQIQYPTVDWFINTDGKAELKTAAAVGDTFLIINLASFLISGCATKDEIAEAANKPKFPLFDLTWRPSRSSILDGTVPADGDTYSRAAYPDAFAAIQAGLVPVCTDAEWLADPSKHGFYTLGDGSTTFRVPDYNGKKTDAIASVVLRGDGKNAGSFGQIQQDCIRNITGSFGGISNSPSRTWPIGIERVVGCFRGSGGAGSYDAGPIASSQVLLPSLNSDVIFEASRVVPTGPENRMTNVAGVWCIRLFNGRVLDGNINVPEAIASAVSAHEIKVGAHSISGISGLQGVLDSKYSPGNIVGQVSQSGGIPTGAIIQRGRNVNGEFVRFADGTQICMFGQQVSNTDFGTLGTNMAVLKQWTFPASFSSGVGVIPSMRVGSGNPLIAFSHSAQGGVGMGSAEILIRTDSNAPTTNYGISVSYRAVGWWYEKE